MLKKKLSKDDKVSLIIGISIGLISFLILGFYIYRSILPHLNFWQDWIKTDKIGFIIQVMAIAIASVFAYVSICGVFYLIAIFLIRIFKRGK